MFGALIEVPAVIAAISPAGAGHGSYVAARALFPLPMLLTLVEGKIGPIAGVAVLLQFPIYGALLGWSIGRHKPVGAANILAISGRPGIHQFEIRTAPPPLIAAFGESGAAASAPIAISGLSGICAELGRDDWRCRAWPRIAAALLQAD